MDPTQPQQSLPWAISQQHPSTREQPGGEGTGRRNSFLQQDKWTLKTCQQCQEVSRTRYGEGEAPVGVRLAVRCPFVQRPAVEHD